MNRGVFGGRGHAARMDALEAIAQQPADVLYLDPPYPGTTSYEREYAVLDELLGAPIARHRAPSLDELLDAAREHPVVVLSYGGPTMTLAELSSTVARHRTVRRAVAIPYRHLGSIASEEKNAQNREFLVLGVR